MRPVVILLLAVCSSLPGQPLSDPELRDLEAAVQKLPNNYVGHYQLGRAYMARGVPDKAREELQKAIQLRPDYVPAKLVLAQLLLSRREYEQVLETAAEILKIDEENIPARLLRAAALTALKRFDEARKLLDMLVAVNSGSPEIWYQMGQLDLAEKRYEDAERAFRRSFEANPSNLRGLQAIVSTYFVQNKTDEALQVLRTEAEKRGNRKDLRITLAETAARAGKLDIALSEYRAMLEKAKEGSPEAGELYLHLGEVYRRQGDLKSSIEALSKARAILPQNAGVVSTLGLSLDLAGRKQEARLLYEEAVKIDPQNAAGLNNLAFFIADLGGDLDRALELAERARQLMPQMSQISDTVGFVHLKRNATDQALEIFRNLVSKEASNSTYRYHLALALAQKGDRAAALRELDEAMTLDPAAEEVLQIKALQQKLTRPE
jgi:tetratricopeptide (TPR) repeat protein